ncbi:MarR family winged helix-turn-helix transcriptional regulator [Streptosporangium sp. NPDC006007]|uniref:MarR family winged helix-turn-helix transcriptional regulator n=1 Tax=Streptosporangium sp. NPDC006007 TaxID=3154575 RepID=UPI0033B03BD4
MRIAQSGRGARRVPDEELEVSEEMARPAGLTAARWQVVGAVLHEPLPVAGIARVMGLTRQSAQRTADLLVEQGLAEYRPNPAHRRAKLLVATDRGLEAVRRINPAHRALADQLTDQLGGVEGFRRLAHALEKFSAALDTVERTDPLLPGSHLEVTEGSVT